MSLNTVTERGGAQSGSPLSSRQGKEPIIARREQSIAAAQAVWLCSAKTRWPQWRKIGLWMRFSGNLHQTQQSPTKTHPDPEKPPGNGAWGWQPLFPCFVNPKSKFLFAVDRVGKWSEGTACRPRPAGLSILSTRVLLFFDASSPPAPPLRQNHNYRRVDKWTMPAAPCGRSFGTLRFAHTSPTYPPGQPPTFFDWGKEQKGNKNTL